MTKKKKPIPILDDVVRTGNTDKAVKGGIDPYPRKLAPRKQKVEISADARPPADKLTDQYARKIKQQDSAPAKQDSAQAQPKPVAQPPVLTETIDKTPDRQTQAPGSTAPENRPAATPDNIDLEPIIDKIVDEMIPDLEQHLRLQLRFELNKHLPRSMKTSGDKDK